VNFGYSVSLLPSSAGDLVFYTHKSMLPLQNTFEHDLLFRSVLGIYKEHAQIDLLEANALVQCALQRVQPKKLDLKALFASFGNETFFSVMSSHLRIFDALRNKLASTVYEETEDIDETPTYHPDLRRLACVLLAKTHCVETDAQQLKLTSLLTHNLQNSGVRDALVKIGRFSEYFSLLKALSSQEDFRVLVENNTPTAIDELNNCFSETKSTRQVLLLDWPRDRQMLSMKSSKCTV